MNENQYNPSLTECLCILAGAVVVNLLVLAGWLWVQGEGWVLPW